jgi:hypothetical protein
MSAIDARRMPIYQYVYSLFIDKVTKYIYPMEMPTKLEEEINAGGFMVIRLGEIKDKSQFNLNALASVRVTVEMYIPPKTRGRLDTTLLEKYETSISDIVNAEVEKAGEKYDISTDGILSTDDIYNESDNLFFMYIKSFMVLIK